MRTCSSSSRRSRSSTWSPQTSAACLSFQAHGFGRENPPQAWCPPGCRGSGITRSLRSGRPGASCLTRVGHRPVVWPHEILDSGISHRNTGSSPRSGTEAGDISLVFAALEHAAGDLTTLGRNPPLGGSSPSDTSKPHERPFTGMLYRRPCPASGRGGVSSSVLPRRSSSQRPDAGGLRR